LFDGDVKSIKQKSNNYNTITNIYAVSNGYDYDHTSMMSFEVQEASVYVEESSHLSLMNIEEQNNDSSSKKNRGNNKKFAKNDKLLTEAQYIIDNFILNDSSFEVNITDKTKKTIIYNLKEIKTNELNQQDFRNKLKTIFDEAYEEVINSLFLNSYMNYILKKNSSNEKK